MYVPIEDALNAIGGWLEERGFPGARPLINGRDEHELFDCFPDDPAAVDLTGLPESWRETFLDSDWMGEGGTFPLDSLIEFIRSFGYQLEPMCSSEFLVALPAAGTVEDRIPF